MKNQNKKSSKGKANKKQKAKKIFKIVFSVLLVAAVLIGVMWFPAMDTQGRYLEKVYSNQHFENTIETAVPQTEIYNIITNHFNSPLPQGKTEKKAIVIGYDGCRLDVVKDIDNKEDGAINLLLKSGGKMYVSYCGGVPYPKINTQATSTAPGWCSMLTGKWADVHGVTDNKIPKSNDNLTMLTSLVENKTIDSSGFYVSWKGHFSKNNSTYINEMDYVKENNLDVKFIRSKNDKGTKETVMNDLKNSNCSDFIFSIFEYCDHAGHFTGFFTGNPIYRNAFKNADKTAEDIINQIYQRESYDTEDWLIILTTDHGGMFNKHGKASIQERYTHIVSNKPLDFLK